MNIEVFAKPGFCSGGLRPCSASAVRWVAVSAWLAVLGASAAPNPPAEFLPAASKWVLHVDAATLRRTELNRELLPLLASLPAPALGNNLQTILSSDHARDVTSVTVCGAGGPQQGGVAYLRGRWDPQKLRAMAAGAAPPTSTRVGGRTVVSWPDPRFPAGTARHYACLVSTNLALLADRELALSQSLEVLEGKEAPLAPTSRLGRLAQPRNRTFIRFAAIDGNSLASVDRTNGILRQVDTQWAGVGLTPSGLRLDATLKTLTPETAAQVQQLLAGSQGVLLLRGLRDPDLALMAQSLAIQTEGKTVNVALALPLDVVKRLLVRYPVR